VINICRYAQRLTGVGKLHAVIGGFHLTGPLFEPTIADTVSALEQLAPDPIVPRSLHRLESHARDRPAACPPRLSRTWRTRASGTVAWWVRGDDCRQPSYYRYCFRSLEH